MNIAILILSIILIDVLEYNSCSNILIVCFDIQLNIFGETEGETSTKLKNSPTTKWELGTCSSFDLMDGNPIYQYSALYTERCCLESGIHILVCYNIPEARGWKNSYLLINGHRYCDDFISYKSFQNKVVTGIEVQILI